MHYHGTGMNNSGSYISFTSDGEQFVCKSMYMYVSLRSDVRLLPFILVSSPDPPIPQRLGNTPSTAE